MPAHNVNILDHFAYVFFFFFFFLLLLFSLHFAPGTCMPTQNLDSRGERGKKLVYQWGEVSYIVFFPTPEKPIFPGGNSSNR